MVYGYLCTQADFNGPISSFVNVQVLRSFQVFCRAGSVLEDEIVFNDRCVAVIGRLVLVSFAARVTGKR